jgi:hypothetical protein
VVIFHFLKNPRFAFRNKQTPPRGSCAVRT